MPRGRLPPATLKPDRPPSTPTRADPDHHNRPAPFRDDARFATGLWATLAAFIYEVRAQTGKKLTAEQAASFDHPGREPPGDALVLSVPNDGLTRQGVDEAA